MAEEEIQAVYKGTDASDWLLESDRGIGYLAHVMIDVDVLRPYRRCSSILNVVSWHRLDAYTHFYENVAIYPANTMVDQVGVRSHFGQTQQLTIERLIDL